MGSLLSELEGIPWFLLFITTVIFGCFQHFLSLHLVFLFHSVIPRNFKNLGGAGSFVVIILDYYISAYKLVEELRTGWVE